MTVSRRHRGWWLGALFLTTCAERASFVGLEQGSPDAGGDVEPWGTWASRLAVPECPPGPVLMVDTAEGELEGGTSIAERSQARARLSLQEALWLAANRPGEDTILFDPAVFPVEAPTTILIEGGVPLPQNLTETCIDARSRGVVVYWGPSARTGQQADLDSIWSVGAGSLQVGLELRALEQGQLVEDGGHVAGCRFFSEEGDHLTGTSQLVRLTDGTLGPGNVLTDWGLTGVNGYGTVTANFFGYDPRSGADVPLSMALYGVGGSTVVEDNLFSATVYGANFTDANLVFRRNVVGADDLHPLTAPRVAVSLWGLFAQVIIGPENSLRATNTGVDIDPLSIVTVTKNHLFAPHGIGFHGGNGPIDPPSISSAGPAQVTGTCPAPGRVELFSGPQGAAERFLGEVMCSTQSPWVIATTPPSGSDLAATLTSGVGRTRALSSPFPVP